MDFMVVSSYGSSTESSGTVKIIKDLDVDIENKNVLIVEEAPQYFIDSNYDIEVYKNMSGILSKLELIDLIDTMNQNLSVIKKGTVQRLQFELLILKLLNYEKPQNKQYVSNSIKENLSVRPIENKNESKTVI